ncbi:protein translocase subunit SecD [Cohnella hashimotonis]|uniref:Multifunctional fusion protein n=1 Tax=Cohnella hashimotonis TaxID=2826895 RepID=A0ABT6TAS3_9BACL|nr:protein translocase subunit SecD [Cohnella hashimotonis]MDI4643933.1 protein translocase subunit SecD [Cohnella hashimotonis]
MIIIKRVVAFLLTVAFTLTIVTATFPNIVDRVRLGLDLKGGFEVLYEANPVQPGGSITKENLRQTANSLEKRVNAFGIAEPEIWTEGTNRIRVRIAGVSDEEKVREMLKKPAELTVSGPDGSVELVGTDFVEGGAEVVYDEMRNPNVQVKVKDKGKLEDLSTRLLGRQIFINLDDRMLTDPVIQAVMSNGICRITGHFTYDEAKEIVDIINMGALPLKLTEKFSQSVGASLGQQSLNQTLQAGVAGSALILLFMLALYRLPGLIASITLITYTWLLLLVMNLMSATLTLPGIAAFVLGIGMAVDANIIQYERFKEELRTGKSPQSALKAGSKRSFRTVMDANVTTLIAGFVLFSLGSGAIKGFAITLILSIILSVLTNMYFSQWLMSLLLRSNWVRGTRGFGVKPEHIIDKAEAVALPSTHRTFDFVARRKTFFLASIIVTVLGIGSLLVQHLNYGVDFKAGTSLDITLNDSIDQETAAQIVRGAGFSPSVLSIGGNQQNRISLRFDHVLDPDGKDSAKIIQAFAVKYGDDISKEENTVDPAIARELARQAVYAVLLASLGILLYVCVRFEWRFALAAIVALLHDAFFVVSVFSLFRLEVNLPFIAAVLTIIGYSINDTVVIFDRIRENLRFSRSRTYEDLKTIVNRSINQTLTRSINTVVAVLFAAVALLFWGSESIRLFSLALTIGLLVGMYSSIYIASQIWLSMKKRTLRTRTDVAPKTSGLYPLPVLTVSYEDDQE